MRLNQISTFLAAVAFCGPSSAETTLSNLVIGSSKATATPRPSSGSSSTPSPSTNRIITVVVGSPTLNKSLVYTPSDITAKPGDIIQFQFSQVNHTVTQSSFAEPCLPIQQSNSSAAGVHSGFVPGGGANATLVQTFNMPINDTKPMFLYCAQGPHCQLGMVMTINANGTENFAAYKAISAKAAKNVPANNFRGGVLGTIPKTDAVAPPI